MNIENKTANEIYSRYQPSSPKFQKILQDKKNQSLAWLSLTIFTVCFFLIVAIKPTLVTIAKLNKEIKDLALANQNLQKKINAIVEAQNEFAKYSDELFLLDQAVPDSSDFPRLAYFLEQANSTEGLELKSLSLDKIGQTVGSSNSTSSSSSELKSLTFSISSSGDYLKLVNFLKDLESSRRILKLTSTSFNQTKNEKDQTSTYELSVILSGQSPFGKVPEAKTK